MKDLNPETVSFLEFGRLISCDDPTVVSQLELIISSPPTWLDKTCVKHGGDFRGWESWEDVIDMCGPEGFYQLAMIEALNNYLIPFWNNMGDPIWWLIDMASRRGIILDKAKLTADYGEIVEPSGGWDSKYQIAESIFIRASEALKKQGWALCQIDDPGYDSTLYACVLSPTDFKALPVINWRVFAQDRVWENADN